MLRSALYEIVHDYVIIGEESYINDEDLTMISYSKKLDDCSSSKNLKIPIY